MEQPRASMNTRDFQYLPLNTDHPTFRLLRLRKGDTIRIECDIFHSPISASNTSVSYEALSYTWGSSDLVDCIEVNGQRLWITASLYSALLCLRSCDCDRILWIDAVCINQSDKVEQSQQVRMMGGIYSFAERVIFWLEKPTPEVMLLMESLVELQRRSNVLTSHSPDLDDKTMERLWSQLVVGSQDSILLDRQRKGLRYLLRKPWFERIWILQEVAKAQSAVVCSGTLSIPAYIFARSPFMLGISPSPHIRSILDIMPQPSRHKSWWSQEPELSDLLYRFRDCKATDARDMIYALLGMSSDPDHELLRPDYTKPVQEVLHNAVRYWFESTNAPISQIIDLLAVFETVHVTYLVLPERSTTPGEAVQIPSSSEAIHCVRDASLIKIEKYPQISKGHNTTFHDELDQLHVHMSHESGPYSRAFRIVPWCKSQQQVKLLVVGDAAGSLIMSGWMETTQIFDFIADKGSEHDPKLLDSTLIKTQEHGYWYLDWPYEWSKQDDLIIQSLLDRGADINSQGGRYGNVLQGACQHGLTEVVQMLLDRGADVNAPGGEYGRALQTASFRDNHEIVRILLDHGADVNTLSTKSGYGTPLHVASTFGYTEIVRLLLSKGADVNLKGTADKTPLQIASSRGYNEIVQMLLENGADVQNVTVKA